MQLFARNEEINRWLEENPLVLGGGALVLGLILLGIGVAALMTGKSTGKYGIEYEGPMAYARGGAFAFFGGLIILFGLYKVAVGMF